MPDKWVKRWKVPSESNPGKEYTVAVDADGNYGCSCPAWTRRTPRKDCKHIRAVKDGGYEPVDAPPRKEPDIVLANVRAVMPIAGDDGEIAEIRVPLMPIGDTHFQATLVHDLLCLGVSWRYCKERYHIAKVNTKQAVIDYVETRGRRIYGPWRDKHGYEGFCTVPCEHPFTLERC